MIHFCIYMRVKPFFFGDNFIISNIVLLLIKKQMSKTQAKKLSIKFIPYLFIVVSILPAFGSNSGTWAWMSLSSMVWIRFGLIAF